MSQLRLPPEELIELATQIRRLNHSFQSLNTDGATLQGLSVQVSALADQLEANQGKERLYDHYLAHEGAPIDRWSPHSFVSGCCNPLSPPIEFDARDDKIIATVTLGRSYEGPHNCVHGGFISSIYDQLLALAKGIYHAPGLTAYLHVDYLKPTPLFKTLEFESWLEELDGRKAFAAGHCYVDGVLVSKANGLFISRAKNLDSD